MATTRATTTAPHLAGAISRALDGRELLTHPFYQRWEAGDLAPVELADYAVQYRAFESVLPTVLAGVVDRLRADGADEAADLVARNLADELGRPHSHLELFDSFATAVHAEAGAPGDQGPAATALADAYLGVMEESPVAALAALAAYETQASAIATSKADGLRRWYGLDDDGVAFWDVHAEMDAEHGEWAVDALAALDADPETVFTAARLGADAWWALLDERQAAAPAA
jgi:pyrroloquinoline-quinone synthase